MLSIPNNEDSGQGFFSAYGETDFFGESEFDTHVLQPFVPEEEEIPFQHHQQQQQQVVEKSPIVTIRKSRGGARVPTFDGEPFEFPVDKLLNLDASGVPILATPILQYGIKQGWSTEALLKQASIGQFNTAVRYWFKGQNLTRQSVLEGAAVMVEWYEALEEGRSRRNIKVDMTNVPEIIKKIASSRKAAGKRRLSGSLNPKKKTKTKFAYEVKDEEEEEEDIS